MSIFSLIFWPVSSIRDADDTAAKAGASVTVLQTGIIVSLTKVICLLMNLQHKIICATGMLTDSNCTLQLHGSAVYPTNFVKTSYQYGYSGTDAVLRNPIFWFQYKQMTQLFIYTMLMQLTENV